MGKTFTETARQIMQHTLNQTPEEWHSSYRQDYPDITPQESGTLYPLFITAMTAKTKAERDRAFKDYRAALAPIKKRNPPQREQELFTWTE